MGIVIYLLGVLASLWGVAVFCMKKARDCYGKNWKNWFDASDSALIIFISLCSWLGFLIIGGFLIFDSGIGLIIKLKFKTSTKDKFTNIIEKISKVGRK